MEHFFNRKPTKGYIELSKEIEKTTNNRHITDENIKVPNHISKAACYVEDARDGRLANGKGKMSEKSRKIQLCFFIQTHAWWARFIYLSIVFMSILIVFEPPSSAAITVCSQNWFNFSSEKPICDNKEIIKDWEAWTLFVEFLLIMIFVTDIFMKATYMKPSVYFTKKWHKVTAFFILLFSIDWIIFTCTYYAMGRKGLRFSRPFRPVLLLTRYRELRRILETLTDMVNDLIRLTGVILGFVLIFAWIGVTLFGKTYRFTTDCVDKDYDNILNKLTVDADYCVTEICWDTTTYPFCVCMDDEDDKEYKSGCSDSTAMFGKNYLPGEMSVYSGSFDNPFIAVIRLIVLISTENYPDVMMPAYKTHQLSLLYFIVFIFIGMFLLLSVLLAVIVEFWLSYLKQTNDNEKRKERLGITKAFIWIDKEQNYYIKEHSWNELILLLKKDFTKLQSHFMFQMLDWEQKGQLDVLDFLNITEALKLHYTLKDADTAIENTEIGQFARRVLSYYFSFTCCGFIKPINVNIRKISIVFSVIHTLLALIHWADVPVEYIIARTAINTILLLVLLSEVLLRVMAHGSGFFHPLINKWEVCSITGAFLAMIGYWITWLSSLKQSTGLTKGTLPQTDDFFRMVWEFLILFRVTLQKGNIRSQLIFMYKVLLVLLELFLFIVIILYVFLGIGLELFAIASLSLEENYFEHFNCKLGFINPLCGFITLLQLITTSNWHNVMNTVQQASGAWAYLYFVMFYICIDLILLDLMIAIAIEMYNAVRSQDSEEAFGDQPGICFEVYEGTVPEQVCPAPSQKPERRRSRLGSIFNTNGTSQPEPYRKLILEVTRSKKGSWRQSIITSEIFRIDQNEIDDIQKSLDKDYPGAKNKDHKHHDERGIEVKLLYSEKNNERMKLNKPDCKLYVKSIFMDMNDKPQGKILMELNDNQSSLHFKLIFKSDSKPIRGIIRSSDEVKCEDYFELDESEFSYHPHTSDYHVYKHWRMKRVQKQNLIQGQVSFLILTKDKPNGAMFADIEGIQQEKARWVQRKEMIAQNAETFGKISPLLQWFAHRVTTIVMKDEDSDGEEETALEEGALKKQEFRRRVYVPNEYKTETKYVNEAHREWLNMYQQDIPGAMGDSPAAVLDQVTNFLVNQANTSGGLLAPPGSIGAGSIGSNRHSFSHNSSSSDDDDDDDDSDDSDEGEEAAPGLQIGGGANKLKGLFEAIANAPPERRPSNNSRKSSTSSYRSQKSNRSQPTTKTPSLIIPQVINTDHDAEEMNKTNQEPATAAGEDAAEADDEAVTHV